jgi:hypothetical protein
MGVSHFDEVILQFQSKVSITDMYMHDRRPRLHVYLKFSAPIHRKYPPP